MSGQKCWKNNITLCTSRGCDAQFSQYDGKILLFKKMKCTKVIVEKSQLILRGSGGWIF